jgi:cytochrome c5
VKRCSSCNTPAPWCWLASLGRCDRLTDPDQARHNAARSLIGPQPAPAAQAEATTDPTEAARLRRAGKPRVEKGCGVCHGKAAPPAEPPT